MRKHIVGVIMIFTALSFIFISNLDGSNASLTVLDFMYLVLLVFW